MLDAATVRALDEGFAAIGLTAEPVGFAGRAWTGSVRGRRVRIDSTPGMPGTTVGTFRVRPLFEIAVANAIDTDLIATTATAPTQPPYERLDRDGFHVEAVDAAWARALLSDEVASGALGRLVRIASPGHGFVRIQRDWLRLSLDPMEIARPAALPGAVGDLHALLDRATTLPPPTIGFSATQASNRRMLALGLGLPLLGCTAAGVLLGVVAALGLLVKFLQHG